MKYHPFATKLWLRAEKIIEIRQSRGSNSSLTDETLIKLHMRNYTMVKYTCFQHKFHESPSIGYLVMAEDRKKSLKFRQSKGTSSSITDDTLIKLQMHNDNHTMVIYTEPKL